MQSSTNISAILRGEQRSTRFRYRHSVAGAARERGIPASWIWAWLLVRRLKSQTWLRKVWVRLENVQELLADPKAVREAFFATGEHPASPEAIQQGGEFWPDESKFQPGTKVFWFPICDPVLGEMDAR